MEMLASNGVAKGLKGSSTNDMYYGCKSTALDSFKGLWRVLVPKREERKWDTLFVRIGVENVYA